MMMIHHNNRVADKKLLEKLQEEPDPTKGILFSRKTLGSDIVRFGIWKVLKSNLFTSVDT